MSVVGFIGLLLGLIALIFLRCFRQIHALMASAIAVFIIIIFNGLPIWETLTGSYAAAIGDWLKGFLIIFTLGAMLGKSLQATGCAQAMGEFLVKKLGVKYVGLIIHILSLMLVYAGVDAVVAVLSIAPIAIAMVKKANLPRRFAIACYLGGGCSYVFGIPGSSSVNNLVPSDAFGTTTLAAWIPGIIGSFVSLACVLIYQRYLESGFRKKSIGFDLSDEMVSNNFGCREGVTLCPAWIGCVSLIFVVLCSIFLGGTGILAPKAAISGGLVFSTAFTLLTGRKYIQNMKVKEILEEGANDGVVCSVLTGAIMGFVAVVQKTAAFSIFADWTMSLKIPTLFGATISIYMMNIVLANSPGTLNVFIENFSSGIISAGIQPAVLHRVLAMSAVSFAAQMPHNPGSIVLTKTFKHSYMSSFKDICVICIFCPIVGTFAAIALIYAGLV